MMKTMRSSTFAGALVALLLFAGCGTSGGLGDILGGGGGSSNVTDIRGTVYDVNEGSGYLDLRNVTGVSSSSSTTRVYFDNQTQVEFQGKTYRPGALERGDEISLRVQESSGRLNAQSITVLRDVSGGSSVPSTGGGTYTSNLRATVRMVDASRRTIDVDTGTFGSTTSRLIEYDARTLVSYDRRSYQPSDLKRGDEVDMTLVDVGGGRWLAERIDVVRSASGGTGGTTTNTQIIRGTVRYHDATRRTLELEQASWVSGFTTNPTSTATVIQYDANSFVEYQGQNHATSGLERGDVIEAHVRNLGGGQYVATRIILIRNARG